MECLAHAGEERRGREEGEGAGSGSSRTRKGGYRVVVCSTSQPNHKHVTIATDGDGTWQGVGSPLLLGVPTPNSKGGE